MPFSKKIDWRGHAAGGMNAVVLRCNHASVGDSVVFCFVTAPCRRPPLLPCSSFQQGERVRANIGKLQVRRVTGVGVCWGG